MKKAWNVEYDHKDGRNGVVSVVTEVERVDGSRYGNQKYGRLSVGLRPDYTQTYDLRYNTEKNLHMVMIRDYFGRGFVKAEEV